MTDCDLCSQRVKAVGNKVVYGPMLFKSSILFISPKLWVTGSTPVGSTYKSLYDAKTVSNEILVILYSSEILM